MLASYDIWKLIAGVAIFLFGIKFIEEALRQMSGRSFKLFLKKQTKSKAKAVLGGAVVTAVLQSSSVVNLMVLAFVGAGIIQMQNSLAVILGSNLGTTFNSWLIATVGFSTDINAIALPLVGIFGIIMYLGNMSTKWYQWSKFLFGIGFLLFGLNYIKSGMAQTMQQSHLVFIHQYPTIIYLLLGFAFTALIQASSVTFAILLSALSIQAIDLYTATAVVLGSEIGTSIKFILASAKGLPEKKRVAFANFLFNVITVTLIFICLRPVNSFITDILHLKDNLLALVFFHSFINIISILLFYPFLNQLGKFLSKRFTSIEDESGFIQKVKIEDTELAMQALENEVKYFILQTLDFTLETFNRPRDERLKEQLGENNKKDFNKKYEFLKYIHGESHRYAILLQNAIKADADDTQRLLQLIAANRNTMYAAKSIKDALPDIIQLRNSANDVKYGFYQQVADKIAVFCKEITTLLLTSSPDSTFKELSELYKSVTSSYESVLQHLYRENVHTQLNEVEISTLINFNREMYTAYKSYLFAVKDYLLNNVEANYFDELPGFIR